MILLVSLCSSVSFAQESEKDKSVFVFKVPNLTVNDFSTLKKLEEYEDYKFISVCIPNGTFAVKCDNKYKDQVIAILNALVENGKLELLELETIDSMEEKCAELRK